MSDKIRAIIEAATPGPWEECGKGVAQRGDYGQYIARCTYESADASFVATFDPEHVALMEAVAEEAEDVHESLEIGARFLNAVWNLRRYRKERGYR